MSKKSDQIHACAVALRKTIEKFEGPKVAVFFGVVHEDEGLVTSGITLSDAIESSDLADILFDVNGRAYTLVDFD